MGDSRNVCRITQLCRQLRGSVYFYITLSHVPFHVSMMHVFQHPGWNFAEFRIERVYGLHGRRPLIRASATTDYLDWHTSVYAGRSSVMPYPGTGAEVLPIPRNWPRSVSLSCGLANVDEGTLPPVSDDVETVRVDTLLIWVFKHKSWTVTYIKEHGRDQGTSADRNARIVVHARGVTIKARHKLGSLFP